MSETGETSDDSESEDFYTPGPSELYDVRLNILYSSLAHSATRTKSARSQLEHQDFIKTLKHRRGICVTLATYQPLGSQLIPGVERAISSTRFSPDNTLIACGSWDGLLSVLDAQDLSLRARVHGLHSEKIGTLDWDHHSSSAATPRNQRIVTGGGEGHINVWNFNDDTGALQSQISMKNAHSQRITNTLFHPHDGGLIVSTSFDRTWKLWDINRPQQELYQQEGHSAEVSSGAFHPDGGIFCLGGLDAVARIWDLRSGRSICTLQKHIKGIYSMDWAPNGYHLATASGDNSVKIWDLRRLERGDDELFTIPAHTKLVSQVRFFTKNTDAGVESLSRHVTDEHDTCGEQLDSNGTFLVTSSYDKSLKIWLADNWVHVRTLDGGADRVMTCDIDGTGTRLVSGGWDRTVKLWGSDDAT